MSFNIFLILNRTYIESSTDITTLREFRLFLTANPFMQRAKLNLFSSPFLTLRLGSEAAHAFAY